MITRRPLTPSRRIASDKIRPKRDCKAILARKSPRYCLVIEGTTTKGKPISKVVIPVTKVPREERVAVAITTISSTIAMPSSMMPAVEKTLGQPSAKAPVRALAAVCIKNQAIGNSTSASRVPPQCAAAREAGLPTTVEPASSTSSSTSLSASDWLAESLKAAVRVEAKIALEGLGATGARSAESAVARWSRRSTPTGEVLVTTGLTTSSSSMSAASMMVVSVWSLATTSSSAKSALVASGCSGAGGAGGSGASAVGVVLLSSLLAVSVAPAAGVTGTAGAGVTGTAGAGVAADGRVMPTLEAAEAAETAESIEKVDSADKAELTVCGGVGMLIAEGASKSVGNGTAAASTSCASFSSWTLSTASWSAWSAWTALSGATSSLAEAGEVAVELCSRLEGALAALTLELVSAAEALSAAEVALAEAALADTALAAEKESGIRSSRTTGTWMVSSSLSSSTGTG